jgi:hypothetical protein
LGFWQATVICLFTVATLGGHDGPCLNTITAPMISTTRPAADAMATLRPRRKRRCRAVRRPRSMSTRVRSWAGG